MLCDGIHVTMPPWAGSATNQSKIEHSQQNHLATHPMIPSNHNVLPYLHLHQNSEIPDHLRWQFGGRANRKPTYPHRAYAPRFDEHSSRLDSAARRYLLRRDIPCEMSLPLPKVFLSNSGDILSTLSSLLHLQIKQSKYTFSDFLDVIY